MKGTGDHRHDSAVGRKVTEGSGADAILPRLLAATPRTRALALLGVIAVLAAGCGATGHVSSRSATDSLESIFEPKAPLLADPDGTLATLQLLGVDRVKVYIPWDTLAPDPMARSVPAGFDAADPAAYPAANWSIYDTIVRDALARGIALDFTLGGPAPVWATGAGAPPGPSGVWKPSPLQFGMFVRAVATRYSGAYKPPGASGPLPRISFWSFWNEPNYGQYLAPQAIDDSTVEISPMLYRGLIDAAWQALHSTGHGADTFLIGELAPRGITFGDNPGTFGGMVPLRFVRALYCVDSSSRPLAGAQAAVRGCPTDAAGSQAFAHANPALFHASGFSVHPYPQGNIPPNVLTLYEPDYADLPAIPNLERTLDRLQAIYGSSARFPIYATEFGYQTDPPERVARAVPPQTAALYMNWSEYISWRDPRIRSYDQFLLADPPGSNTPGAFATGLEFANGTPKATYAAYRMPIFLPVTSAAGGRSLEVWGCARPARYASGAGHAPEVRIQFQKSTGTAFRTVRSVAVAASDCYFDVQVAFPATGTVRLAWRYPNGTEIYSRTVAVAIH